VGARVYRVTRGKTGTLEVWRLFEDVDIGAQDWEGLLTRGRLVEVRTFEPSNVDLEVHRFSFPRPPGTRSRTAFPALFDSSSTSL
jgi:hypothetical protein